MNIVCDRDGKSIKYIDKLGVLKKAGKNVLVTIDEITYSENVAKFSNAMSSYAGADYDIYVLMTGLTENVPLLFLGGIGIQIVLDEYINSCEPWEIVVVP